MKTVRSRLLVSYTLVLLVCLAVVAVALMLFLLRSPLPDQPVYWELTAISRLAQLRPVVDDFLSAQAPERTTRALQRIADTQNVRVMLAQMDGLVVADTGGELVGHNLLGEAQLTKRTADLVQGSYRPVGTLQRWLFVGRALATAQSPEAASPRWLIVSRQAPRLPLFELYGENMLSWLLQAGLLGLILSVLMAWLISRWVARPIQRTTSAAKAVADGDYDQQLPLEGPQEVQQLAETFNQMAQQVKAGQQAQRDFVANVSHDLKTPLTSIQGFSQAIQDGTADDLEEARRVAGIIHQEAERMRRMVDGLLLLARMDAGELAMAQQPVDLASLLGGCITRLEPRANQAGVEMTLSLPEESLPAITGDPDRLIQLFTNLLDNALKHTPAGGRVTLSADSRNDQVTVAVADTGPGIPADQLSRIFERFYQVDKSRARTRREGAGLGLAICKELAEAHDGRIEAESVVGVGSKFSVHLPSAAAAKTLVHRHR